MYFFKYFFLYSTYCCRRCRNGFRNAVAGFGQGGIACSWTTRTARIMVIAPVLHAIGIFVFRLYAQRFDHQQADNQDEQP